MSNFISSSDSKVGQHLHYYRQLLSKSIINLSELENSFLAMDSIIKDLDGFNYAVSRLPQNIATIKNIIISSKIEIDPLIFDIKKAVLVSAPNRRRLMYIDAQKNLFVLLNSYSDLDDLINCLISFRLGFTKIKTQNLETYPEILNLEIEQFNPRIQLLLISESDFSSQADNYWNQNIAKSLFMDLESQPVYLVSSNTHSLANIIGGFLNQKQNYIFDYIAHTHTSIYDKWFASKTNQDHIQINDFLYYLASTFLSDNSQFIAEKRQYESTLGIINLPASDSLPIDLQIIPLKSLNKSQNPDSNLVVPDLSQNNGIIINIQYPLGIAAKYLLDSFINKFSNIKGIYVIGKAAILNGLVGDIQIPEIVLDEITNNVYQFDNIFNEYFPNKGEISQILSHQKSACVYGTLLENSSQIENYKKSNFNIIEMESGHYLASILENFQLHEPISKSFVYKLQKLPFDFGIINYASDNPLTENLSKESIDFRGIETSYLSSLNVLSRIIELEK